MANKLTKDQRRERSEKRARREFLLKTIGELKDDLPKTKLKAFQTEIETLNEFFGLSGKGGKRGKAPIEWNDERLAKFQKLAKLNSGDVIRYDGKKLKKKSVAILLKVEDEQGKAKTISDLDKITF